MPYEFIALEEDDDSAIANPEQLQQVLQDDAGRYLDFSAALNEDCLDTEQVHRQTMQSVLRVCYWSLFFLGWVGVPFVQGILLSSEFSLRCAPLARERPPPPARSRSRLTAAIGAAPQGARAVFAAVQRHLLLRVHAGRDPDRGGAGLPAEFLRYLRPQGAHARRQPSPRRSLSLSCRLLPSARRSAKHSPMPLVCSCA